MDQLKQVVKADKADIIKPSDLESFLTGFNGDVNQLEQFKDGLENLLHALNSKILHEISESGQHSVSNSRILEEESTFTTNELKEILNVSKQTVQNWIDKHGLVAEQKVAAGKYYIKETAIVKFLNGYSRKHLKTWNLFL